ncbi:MAG TPA: zinc-ribbon domain-containing protein [Desulfosporosinus sp.]|nr:zinc-ribbon domain-containing protein [Desulfosporosinus sp.]
MVIKGKNVKRSFADTYPELAEQAAGWDATAISAGSGIKVLWRCSQKHEWTATPNSRSKSKSCPVCGNRKVLKGFNDLETTHPELASEANGWDPTSESAGSHQKVSWCCKKKHIWDARIDSRTSQGNGCPACSGRNVVVGENDLATEFPEIAARAYGWNPGEFTSHSGKKMQWRCPKGHIWKSAIVNQTNGSGCSVCSGHAVLMGFNDLATVNPEVAAQAFEWDPTTLTAGSGAKRKWRCLQGHIWTAPVAARTTAELGCPICAGRMVLAGFNDLTTAFPSMAAEADGWDPRTVTAYSHKRVQWICSKGDRWETSIASRTSQNSGCPVCSGHIARQGHTDLQTTHPELARQAVGWDPSTLKAGSQKKVGWRCPKNHEYKARIASRTLQNTGCPICVGKQALAGYNDLATTHPGLAKEAYEWDPTTLTAGSGLKRKWRCPLGHIWTGVVGPRASRNFGCPYCSSRQVLVGFNDFATTHETLAKEAYGWDPTTLTAGSNLRRKWTCSEGHQWTTSILNRTLGGTRCPSCAVYGFNPSKKAHLYFLEHESWGLLQIGISNDIKTRLRLHLSRGWKLIEIRGPMDGSLVYDWEQSILLSLKKRGVVLGTENAKGKFDGYTESWSKDSFSASTLKELMDLVHEDEI